MNILVLGATGYLGSNLAKHLSDAGHHVICAVRRTSDLARLSAFRCQIVSSEPGQMELTFKQNKMDWVIHGATTYKPNDSLYGDLFESNLVLPLRVLNLAIKYEARNFMTMGTGLPDHFNVYSFTKARLSEFGKYLGERDAINFADLRLEMFYGGQFEPHHRFMKSCVSKLRDGKDIELTEGTQRRDIVRVEDILGIVECLVESQYVQGYRMLPIGSGESYSIREIVQYMARKMGSASHIHFGVVGSRPGEPDTLANIDWYKDISFSLRYHFFEGLDDYCAKAKTCG